MGQAERLSPLSSLDSMTLLGKVLKKQFLILEPFVPAPCFLFNYFNTKTHLKEVFLASTSSCIFLGSGQFFFFCELNLKIVLILY